MTPLNKIPLSGRIVLGFRSEGVIQISQRNAFDTVITGSTEKNFSSKIIDRSSSKIDKAGDLLIIKSLWLVFYLFY